MRCYTTDRCGGDSRLMSRYLCCVQSNGLTYSDEGAEQACTTCVGNVLHIYIVVTYPSLLCYTRCIHVHMHQRGSERVYNHIISRFVCVYNRRSAEVIMI